MKKTSRIKNFEKKINELETNWKRALADYCNLEKRVEKEKKEFVRLSNAILLDKLLSVLDSLEQAEAHLKDKGLSLALDQFRSILAAEGIREIQAQGEKFNAETMDCVEVVRGVKNEVVEVVNKGYELNGHVLRPAKVKVGQGDKKRKE